VMEEVGELGEEVGLGYVDHDRLRIEEGARGMSDAY
jgi:hypothetical protein